MKFYNSLSKKLEEFPKQSHVSIYSCGPTVYDYAHIGNLRTFLFEDLLIRTLKSAGYTVSHTRNITDVDDKTIQRSQEQNLSLKQFTEQYTNAFFEDLSNLNFDQSTTSYLKATDYINDMIALIEELIAHHFAYESKDGVYFKSSAYKDYGNFAGLDLEHIQDGASGSDLDFQKEDVGDFVLWKKNKGEEVFWESPWGRGRPGWHTECAAMVQREYPNGLDIHTGGIDLLFPHHTNEKAHCECLSQKPMAKFWLHATHLLVDNKKMSKSLNNFYTVRDLAKQGFDYNSIRFYLQTGAHYRSPLNFTLEGLKGAGSALKRINNFIQELSPRQEGEIYPLREKFESYLHDDLNISGAIGEIFTLINNYYNGTLFNTQSILDDLMAINQILGVLEFSQETVFSEDIIELLQQRNLARQAKDWQESDRLRDELLKLGIEVRDNKENTTMRKIK
ncbi:MAG: cysteine--tRNA ligase [Brevinema sp.]